MSLQTLTVTTYPIYLPNDTVPVPFGQPMAATATHASPAVFTVPGYAPVNGDLIALSAEGASSAVPGGFTVGTIYFVVSASNDSFELSATEGGSAISSTSTGTGVVVHIINSAQPVIDLPFKPGNSVVVYNPTDATAVLEGAPDTNVGNGGNNNTGFPAGPGSYTNIVSVAAYQFSAPVTLDFDWIRVTSGGPLQLLQV